MLPFWGSFLLSAKPRMKNNRRLHLGEKESEPNTNSTLNGMQRRGGLTVTLTLSLSKLQVVGRELNSIPGPEHLLVETQDTGKPWNVAPPC